MKNNEHPIRVAEIVGDMVDGGVDNLVLNYYENIDRSKYQFDFIASDRSTNIKKDQIESLGGRVIIISSYKNPAKYIYQLKKIFLKNKYSIVHSHMNSLSVIPLMIAKKCGVPVRIAHSHSGNNHKEFLRAVIKDQLRPFSRLFATHLVACSTEAGSWLFGKKAVKNNKVFILKDAVNIDLYAFSEQRRKSIRSSYEIPEDSLVIGNVGRLVPTKNQSFLLKVFSIVRENNPNSFLLLVGDGPSKEKLKLEAKQFGIEKYVVFAGAQSDVSPFYSAMDCFAFPSLYEGFGMAALEAQINGLPCLLSKKIPQEIFGLSANTKALETTQKTEKLWARYLCEFKKHRLTDNKNLGLFRGSGYDIKKCASSLSDFYDNCLLSSIVTKDKCV